MRIQIDPSALKETRWYEFGVRFLCGGLITAATGVIAKKFGPGVGGLFLAFPAIFPASATLIEKHEKQKKERAGVHGSARGRKAAAVDAAGAAIGSIGLLAFALLVKRFLASHSPWLVLAGSTVIWLAGSLLLWQIRKRM
ncbi:MAG: DUF3147 family protein [Candidatus Sulfotelmatobacter sp.]|jgi:hypothetical protein